VLADSGEVGTIEDAEAALATYGVRVVLDRSVEESPSLQVIALTAINTAARSFLGNVCIDAPSDAVLRAPGFEGRALSEFATWAGVSPKLHGPGRRFTLALLTAVQRRRFDRGLTDGASA
jgi:hypothetical protein